MGTFLESGKEKGSERKGMGSVFHMVCPRYGWSITPIAPVCDENLYYLYLNFCHIEESFQGRNTNGRHDKIGF